MAHHHHHHHSAAEKGIRIAFFLNFGFAIAEIIGGAWINSYAIMADAVHDMGDSLVIGFAWAMQRLAKKESDEQFTFGYQRFALLGALLNSVILIAGSILIIYHAIPRFYEPAVINVKGMFVFSVVGILVNGMAVFQMKKGSNSLNERVVTLHLLEDVLGWVAVLIGSVVIYFYGWTWVDIALSLLIALYVIYNASLNLKETILILLQETPLSVDLDLLNKRLVNELDMIESLHDIHIWSLDGEHHVMSVHVVLKEEHTELIELKKQIRLLLKSEHIEHVTIEFEYLNENCHHRCN